jgi:hypothetical protein
VGRRLHVELLGNRIFTNMIPQSVVTDRQGAVVIDSAKIGGPIVALKQFEALLKKSSG